MTNYTKVNKIKTAKWVGHIILSLFQPGCDSTRDNVLSLISIK